MNACEVNVDITMSAPQTEQSTARIHSQPPEEPIQHAKHDDPLTLSRPTIAIRDSQRRARPPARDDHDHDEDEHRAVSALRHEHGRDRADV